MKSTVSQKKEFNSTTTKINITGISDLEFQETQKLLFNQGYSHDQGLSPSDRTHIIQEAKYFNCLQINKQKKTFIFSSDIPIRHSWKDFFLIDPNA